MARDFATFFAQPQAYRNSLPTQNIGIGLPISGPIGSIPVIINWADYQVIGNMSNPSVEVNLGYGYAQQRIDRIRSITIDNTFSVLPVYVYFPDTQITYTAPPNCTVVTPVTTGNLTAIIFVEGLPINQQPPLTVVHFTNVVLPPVVIENPYDAPVVGVVNGVGTGWFNPPLTSISLTGSPTGSPAADRVIALAIMAELPSGTGALTLVSATIDGQPMLIPVQSQSNSVNTSMAAIACVPWPSGTTANFSFQVSAAVEVITVCSYSLYRVQNASPSSISSNFGSASNRSIILQHQAGSAFIGCSAYVDTSVISQPVWTGGTTDYFQQNNLAPPYVWNSGISGTTVAPVTSQYSCNPCNVIVGASWR